MPSSRLALGPVVQCAIEGMGLAYGFKCIMVEYKRYNGEFARPVVVLNNVVAQ